MGLSIVKHGAILHHATIHLDSTEQVGTTIEILFTGDTKQENNQKKPNKKQESGAVFVPLFSFRKTILIKCAIFSLEMI